MKMNARYGTLRLDPAPLYVSILFGGVLAIEEMS